VENSGRLTLCRALSYGKVRKTRHQEDEADRDVWDTSLGGPGDNLWCLTFQAQTVETSARGVKEGRGGGEDGSEDNGVDQVGQNWNT
jgi:hypothetical protein